MSAARWRSAWLAAGVALRLAGLGAALLASGCSGAKARVRAPAPVAAPPAPDSATVGVWHLDESGGTGAEDGGPFRLGGIAGIDTHTDFGRFRSARVFENSNNSFVYVPYNPAMDVQGAFTIEAWVRPGPSSQYELQVIAARWSPAPNEQCWVLGMAGANWTYPDVPRDSPGWFRSLMGVTVARQLIFGFVPSDAGSATGYASTTKLAQGRWTHVAATVDGEVVRLYIDGQLDAQYISPNTIRRSTAPLVIGSVFDPRYLTSFGGDLRIDPSANVTLFYPFIGTIDEVRLSRGARSRFEGFPGR